MILFEIVSSVGGSEEKILNTELPDIRETDGLIDEIADWLMAQALGDGDIEALAEGCNNRLHAAGIPLFRAHLSYRTLHPLFAAIALTWYRGEGLGTEGLRHADAEISEAWQQSPHRHMIKTDMPILRRQLTGNHALLDFPVLEEFRDKGGTDYLAFAIPFSKPVEDGSPREGVIGSWLTDHPAGFSDSQVRSLVRIQQRLAVAVKVASKDQIARNILNAYLGPDAGGKVLEGQIQRGAYENIHAVIWYSDMRNSTAMAESLTPEQFFTAVNRYFDCTAGAILTHGGEVLRFIGDAVLGIFPIRDGQATVEDACTQALAAAEDAQRRLEEINREYAIKDIEPLAFGTGLHVGSVLYGNIGVPERLEFSVIGTAANEVARIEDLTKPLGQPLLVSAEFVSHSQGNWKSLGRHELRGVAECLEVFTPAHD